MWHACLFKLFKNSILSDAKFQITHYILCNSINLKTNYKIGQMRIIFDQIRMIIAVIVVEFKERTNEWINELKVKFLMIVFP